MMLVCWVRENWESDDIGFDTAEFSRERLQFLITVYCPRLSHQQETYSAFAASSSVPPSFLLDGLVITASAGSMAFMFFLAFFGISIQLLSGFPTVA
jgi:hypothetical protein